MIQKLYFCVNYTFHIFLQVDHFELLHWSQVCLLTMIQKLYFCVNYTFHLFLQVDHFELLHWSQVCVSSNDDTKALFLCELHFSLIFTSRPLNDQRTDKQLMNLLYNDVKNLNSIFSCCNCVNIVPSKKD